MMKNKLKLAIQILSSVILLALLLTGCQNGLLGTGNNGNVTVTVDANNTARTLRPSGITSVSAFERIEVEFSKDNVSAILTIPKGQASGTISLEQGTWSISAKGFIKIDGREYEAAQGFSSVTVGTGPVTAPIRLETGIFDGKPGVFSYTIAFPANINEAVLDINPLNDLYGYGTSNTGKTVNLAANPSGSFELSPGYYLLNLTAKIGSTIAVWNELVHIYSGQKTDANHTFTGTDFAGSVTLSGFLYGGKLNGEYIEKVVLTAYGDENYLARVASAEVSLAKLDGQPLYKGSLSISVPSSMVGKTLYLVADETLTGGPAGTRNHIRRLDSDNIEVTAEGTTDIAIGLDYVWWHWDSPLSGDSMVFTVDEDGTANVTTSQKTDYYWDIWKQQMGLVYPAENDFRYVYEFEAWTDGAERVIRVIYIERNDEQFYKDLTINATRQTYTVVSDVRFDSKAAQQLKFFFASHTVTGAFHIKMKSIKTTWEYVPPEPAGGPRWSAAAQADGIKFTVNLGDLPDYINNLVIRNQTNGSLFTVDLDWGNLPDEYQVIFPYVTAGKDYEFSLGSWEDKLADNLTVTASGGRGELVFSNIDQLLLLQEANTVKLNKTPALSVTETNAVNARYVYEFMTGTSWAEPSTQWQIAVDKIDLAPVDLLDTGIFPGWVLSSLAGKTSFATVFYTFDYNNNDIYPIASVTKGSFRTDAISSVPFTYPSKITGVFTAEPDPEGVKFTVDLNQISFYVEWLQFHTLDWSAQWGVSRSEWEDPEGQFYATKKVEIIYPFVSSGKTYQFGVEFNNTGTGAEATVTPTAGLGEVRYSNRENMGLIYNSKTKTLTFNGINTPAIHNDQKITLKYWEWQFIKGRNWNDGEWIDAIRYEELTQSIVLDTTFKKPWITTELSEKSAFVQVQYKIIYGGREYSFESMSSPPFMFPYFAPVGEVATGILRHAFETNENLYINYDSYVYIGGVLYVFINDYNWYNNYPARSYAFYIDGVLKYSGEENQVNLPTTGLSPGRHYGLAVVSIDGAIFSKEFAFTVQE
jgi:predicted small secreted protein